MKILVADDDLNARQHVETLLRAWGHDVAGMGRGGEVLVALTDPEGPALAILGGSLSDLDGVEVCRRLRLEPPARPMHLLLLSASSRPEDVAHGLTAGADDCLLTPFDPRELCARLNLGIRLIELQIQLATQRQQFEQVLAGVKQLQGLLPICAWCKRVRDGQDYWRQIEDYITSYSNATFTHSICPDCSQKMTP